MWCYRRFGHNEGDEPSFTQPLMYKTIRQHPPVSELFAARLIDEGVIDRDFVTQHRAEFIAHLEEEFKLGADYKPNKADWFAGRWSGLYAPKDDGGNRRNVETGVTSKLFDAVGRAITTIPDDVDVHKTLRRVIDARAEMFKTGENFDWATGEALAFGTLLSEGYQVRLSGQDSGRGTFSQRHAVWVDQTTEAKYVPLKTLPHGRFEVLDSPLSEYGVLGFEYGYAMADPKSLVLWEAQFGDFANGAQIMIDQFIASGEAKWLRANGLVMLLPHGYEGQGPEHSSARLERFLQLCAQDNMQVANCTTPANYFHILRRQMRRNFRKPLVLMTPKSLLRHKKCVSTLQEMGPGSSFHRVLWDDAEYRPGSTVKLVPDAKIRRVVICSGKVYYDLLEEREKRGIDDIYILRVEQLYPFPAMSLMNELQRFRNAEMIWCQEEPKNMGAWFFMEPNIEWTLQQIDAKYKRPRYVGRAAAASPATGLMSRHKQELAEFLNEALTF